MDLVQSCGTRGWQENEGFLLNEALPFCPSPLGKMAEPRKETSFRFLFIWGPTQMAAPGGSDRQKHHENATNTVLPRHALPVRLLGVGVSSGCQVMIFDIFGTSVSGRLRDWSSDHDHWSVAS